MVPSRAFVVNPLGECVRIMADGTSEVVFHGEIDIEQQITRAKSVLTQLEYNLLAWVDPILPLRTDRYQFVGVLTSDGEQRLYLTTEFRPRRTDREFFRRLYTVAGLYGAEIDEMESGTLPEMDYQDCQVGLWFNISHCRSREEAMLQIETVCQETQVLWDIAGLSVV